MRDSDGDDAKRARRVLALLIGVYLVFAACSVPRLTNTVVSDVDLTGWTTPIAARVASGQKLYDDMAVPLPPGAPLLLAAVQRMQGRALVLQELWVVALCHLCMALLAYAIAARLTSRQNALLTAIATLALLVSVPHELAFSSLAQLSAWGSLALGLQALLESRPRRSRHAWAATGFCAAFAFAFHQLVALGALSGWLLAFAYRFVVQRWARKSCEDLRAELFAFLAGALAAVGAVTLLALVTGSSLVAFVRNVLGDAVVLGGSWRALGENIATVLALQHSAYVSSLVLTCGVIALGFAVENSSGLSLSNESAVQAPLDTRRAFAIAVPLVAAFGGAAWLLRTHGQPLPIQPAAVCMSLGVIPAFGLLFAGAFFVANWLWARSQAFAAQRFAHAFNAFVVAAIGTSVVSSLAFEIDVESRFVERPSIVLGFMCLFIALGRARLGWLAACVLVASLSTMYGPKLNRALMATSSVEDGGAWSGMRVSYRGEELLHAAARVQALASSDETLLVVPEDAHISALFGRPRPPLRGALAFVHTYPARLVDQDIERLDRAPPKVIVIHPRREEEWRRLFAKWSKESGAAELAGHVLGELVPRRYRLDSSFRTVGFEDMGQLDIWVRVDAEPAVGAP